MGIIGGPPRPRAHPRSRGENFCAQSTARSTGGSSPLTRGKPCHQARRLPARGLIPAHAGKTFRRRGSGHQPRAHPRSRGENSSSPSWRVVLRGSSPLTRGKQRRPRLRDPEPRLIPAHAGKTSSASSARADLRAHPRSRGENPRPARPSTASAGSSPLTRGKPQELPNLLDGLGLIPAHAGKTSIGCVPLTIPWAHPRSRGENVDRCERVTDNAGSSPLTRGKRAPGRGCRHRRGLIPAHAGKTTTSTAQQQPPRAHPRSRGENYRLRVYTPSGLGSSPLTRGKR